MNFASSTQLQRRKITARIIQLISIIMLGSMTSASACMAAQNNRSIRKMKMHSQINSSSLGSIWRRGASLMIIPKPRSTSKTTVFQWSRSIRRRRGERVKSWQINESSQLNSNIGKRKKERKKERKKH